MAFARDPYTASAAQTDFTITFPYLAEDDVVVTKDGVLQVVGALNDYTFSDATTIKFVVAMAGAELVILKRSTSQSARLVNYTAGPLTEADLDNDSLQAFYMAQEASDTANTALHLDNTDNWDGESKRIKLLGAPTAATDASTKKYVDDEVTAAELGDLPLPVTIANGGTNSITKAAARIALGPWSDALVTATGGSAARAIADIFADVWNVKAFGALGDGATDDATAIQAALDAANSAGGGTVYFPGSGAPTYMVGTTLTVGDNTTVDIQGAATIKLVDLTNGNMFENKDASGGNVRISFIGEGILEGNKAGQTAGQASRGIVLTKVGDSGIGRITVQNFEDYGIRWFLDGVLKGNWMNGTVARSNGKDGSSVGASGCGITSGLEFTLTDILFVDNLRTGCRIDGNYITFNGGIISRNALGGIKPVSGGCNNLTLNGTVCNDNIGAVSADGISLISNDRINLNGVTCEGNDGAGVLILNGCNDIQFQGGLFRNNGNNATGEAATTGRDGITIKNDGTVNDGIQILGARCTDDRGGSATQNYGISIEDSSLNITVDFCDLRTNEVGALRSNSSGLGVRIGKSNRGITYGFVNNAVNSHTGDTNETDLVSQTILAHSLSRKNGFDVEIAGTITGTAGTKVVKFKLGSTSIIVSSQTAGATDNFVARIKVRNNSIGGQIIITTAWQGNAVEVGRIDIVTQDFSSDVICKVTGQLGDGGDAIQLRQFEMIPAD